MKCDNCNNECPEDNIARICINELDPHIETSRRGYNNAPNCNCCKLCRDKCKEEALEEQY